MGVRTVVQSLRDQVRKLAGPPPSPWKGSIAIVEYDPSVPGEQERVEAEVEARARADGWIPELGIFAIFVPKSMTEEEEAESDS